MNCANFTLQFLQKTTNKGRKSISTGQKKAVILHRILKNYFYGKRIRIF